MMRPMERTVYRNHGNPALLALVPPRARAVLDVGCGAGDNARLLAARGLRVTGVTFSPEEAHLASQFCETVHVVDLERDALPIAERAFDVLLLSHVLEHLADPPATLRRLAPALAPGGCALIALPNMAHWRMRVRMAAGDWRRQDHGPMDRTHLHFYSFDTAPRLLDDTPFRLELHLAGDPAAPMWPLRRLAPSLCARADALTGRLRPNLVAIQTLIRATGIFFEAMAEIPTLV
jgi:SAM-dependent methyltransferase